MKKRSILTVLLLALLISVLAGTGTPAALAQIPAEPMGAKAVWLAHYDTFEAGDLDKAMDYIADNIVSVVLPPPPGTEPASVGKEAYHETSAYLLSDHPAYEWISIQEDGNTLMFRARFNADTFRGLGVGPINFTGTAVVQEGKIVAETWIMDPYDEARFFAAAGRAGNIAVVDRFYREIWSAGNMETLDEIIGEDFIDHYSGENGREAFRSRVLLFREAFPDLTVTYENMLADGDLVVAQVTFTGTYAGGAFAEVFGVPDSAIGKTITLTGVDYARIVDGQMVEGWGSHDDLGWFGQFGLELQVVE